MRVRVRVWVRRQVCLEGDISQESVRASLARGERASGDLIPWTLSQQFQDNDFPQLSGARIVRIATHPDLQRMGYASRALQQLTAYYEGKLTNLSEVEAAMAADADADADEVDQEDAVESKSKATLSSSSAAAGGDSESSSAVLLEEKVKPRKRLPPLLKSLSDRPPEPLNWIGTSFGLTQGLYNFWKKNRYVPVYVRQTANDLTGEHSVIMLRSLSTESDASAGSSSSATTSSSSTAAAASGSLSSNADWLRSYSHDFRRRVLALLSVAFRSFDSVLALSILDPDPALIATNPGAFDSETSTNELASTSRSVGRVFREACWCRSTAFGSVHVHMRMCVCRRVCVCFTTTPALSSMSLMWLHLRPGLSRVHPPPRPPPPPSLSSSLSRERGVAAAFDRLGHETHRVVRAQFGRLPFNFGFGPHHCPAVLRSPFYPQFVLHTGMCIDLCLCVRCRSDVC